MAPLSTLISLCAVFAFVLPVSIRAAPSSGIQERKLSSVGAFNVQTIDIPLDHFTTDNRTFKNRFFVNDTYYKPGGPVFFYDNGEQGASSSYIQTFLAPPPGTYSAPMQLAQQFGGLAILWEHRFFGESQYFEYDQHTGVFLDGYDAYRYLTVDQALEDVVYFAQNFNKSTVTAVYKDTVDPGMTPWVFMGGSYPGVRAALMRVRNPDVIYASWASSAPVESMADMGDYWLPLTRVLAANCSADISSAIQSMDEILTSGNETAAAIINTAVYLALHATTPGNWSDQYIQQAYEAASNLSVLSQANQINSWSGSWQDSALLQIDPFCDLIETFNPNAEALFANFTNFDNSFDGQPTDGGINATYGPDQALDAFIAAAYKGAIQLANTTQNATFDEEPDAVDAIQTWAVDNPSWGWIRASEFGNWQSINTTFDTLHSSLDTLKLNEASDQQYLPFLPQGFPNVSLIDRYGGWTMNPANVMFTNGDWDGWMSRSVQADESVGGPGRTTTQDIPQCNIAPSNTSVFGLIYPGLGHAHDLAEWSTSYNGFNVSGADPHQEGLALFASALSSWLPCFANHTVTSEVTATAAPSPSSASATAVATSGSSGPSPSATSSAAPTSLSSSTGVRLRFGVTAGGLVGASLLFWLL